MTEAVYALGAESMLVATDTTSLYPDAATRTPKVGYLRQLSAEGVLSLRPDAVIGAGEAGPAIVLDQLRAMGLVDWECDPQDRRAKCIALTARGRKTVARILTRSLEIERSILVDVTPEEPVVLRSALEKISRRFDVL